MDNFQRFQLSPQEQFDELLAGFRSEYEERFDEIMPECNNLDNARLTVRDEILPNYPELEYCYAMHGNFIDVPWEDQPTSAKRGRKVAGVMFGVAEAYDARCQEDRYAQLPLESNSPSKARFISKSEVMDAEEVVPQSNPAKKTPIYKNLAEEGLRGVRPGKKVILEYSTKEIAYREQSLVPLAVDYLGWNKGAPKNSRSYRTAVRSENGTWYLHVHRLENPRPAKRYESR